MLTNFPDAPSAYSKDNEQRFRSLLLQVIRDFERNGGGIANDAVTYAKIQNVSATDRLLGRSTSGAGDVEEIACTAAGRALLDDTNAAAQLTTLGVSSFMQALLDATSGINLFDQIGYRYALGVIADDGAATISKTLQGIMLFFTTTGSSPFGMVFVDTGDSPGIAAGWSQGGTVGTYIAALDGNDGTDGQLNIGAQNGEIHIENRLGAARTYYAYLFGTQ